MATTPADAPADDEVEVCLLGRGVGECIVVHLGQRRWMVIDSFNRSRHEPAALWYLRSVNVDPAQVEVLVTTHFHRDHHLGIDRLHDACSNARLVTTGALGKEQFRKLRASDDEIQALGGLAGTIESAKARESAGGSGWLRAQIGQIIATGPNMLVQALSPTTSAIAASDSEVGQALQVGWDAVVSKLRDDNRSSVTLLFDVEGIRGLLCADLPGIGSFGWQAVLADPLTSQVSGVDLVKAGHHGSVTAHLPGMWSAWVDASATVLVAPFSTSGIPKNRDIARLRGVCGEVWQAAPSGRRWTEEDGIRVSRPAATGYVRARRCPGEPGWRMDSYPPGRKVA